MQSPKERKAKQKEWRDANPDRVKVGQAAWRAENTEARKAYMQAWRAANSFKVTKNHANRRAAKLQRTPKWADPVATSFAYYAADVIHSVYGGTKPQVDHTIPLQGKNVSGLHVEGNLQLLSAKDNKRKSNSWIT